MIFDIQDYVGFSDETVYCNELAYNALDPQVMPTWVGKTAKFTVTGFSGQTYEYEYVIGIEPIFHGNYGAAICTHRSTSNLAFQFLIPNPEDIELSAFLFRYNKSEDTLPDCDYYVDAYDGSGEARGLKIEILN